MNKQTRWRSCPQVSQFLPAVARAMTNHNQQLVNVHSRLNFWTWIKYTTLKWVVDVQGSTDNTINTSNKYAMFKTHRHHPHHHHHQQQQHSSPIEACPQCTLFCVCRTATRSWCCATRSTSSACCGVCFPSCPIKPQWAWGKCCSVHMGQAFASRPTQYSSASLVSAGSPMSTTSSACSRRWGGLSG